MDIQPRLLQIQTLAELKLEFHRHGFDPADITKFWGNGPSLLVLLLVPNQLLDLIRSRIVKYDKFAYTFHKHPDNSRLLISGNRIDLKKFANNIALFDQNVSTRLLNILELEENPPCYELNCRGLKLPLWQRTHIMGILNVTPDSFSDGGQFDEPEIAVAHAFAMKEAGADIIDIGGESTRPGAESISVDEELARIMPVIEKIIDEIGVPVSIDTYKSKIARSVLQAGVHMINDISGLRFDKQMPGIVAEFAVPVVIMHIKGTPKEMQVNPSYNDLLGEISDYIAQSITIARNAGIDPSQIVIDPGIGFGKRLMDNYEILRRLSELKSLGCPILVGPSRKSFIGNVLKLPPNERFEGTAAAVTAAILNGAHIIRAHDVKEIKRVTRIADLINEAGIAHQ